MIASSVSNLETSMMVSHSLACGNLDWRCTIEFQGSRHHLGQAARVYGLLYGVPVFESKDQLCRPAEYHSRAAPQPTGAGHRS